MSEHWTVRYLRHVLDEVAPMTPTALAKKAGISSTTLTRPLNSPDHHFDLSSRTVEKIAEATGVSPAPFVGGGSGTPTRVENHEVAPNGKRLISVYDVAASAGHGAFVDYEAHAYSLAFPPAYLKRLTSSSPANLAIISVKGDSMEPTLLDDDIVMLDTSKTHLAYDGLFALEFDGVLHVKRVGRSGQKGHVRVISDNRLFDPIDMPVEDVRAIGKVLWYGRKV